MLAGTGRGHSLDRTAICCQATGSRRLCLVTCLVASGMRMANLPGLTTPNEVRLASDVQLGEHGLDMPFRSLEPHEKK